MSNVLVRTSRIFFSLVFTIAALSVSVLGQTPIVSPPSLVTGAQNAQLRVSMPGIATASLVYFLPLGSAGSPTGTAITVNGFRVLSNSLLLVDVTVRPDARTGAYQMNVLTSSTVFHATVQLLPGSSFAAPLEVRSVALVEPRDGTVVSYGAELYGEAVLAGSGTGTVLGEWLWDGAVSAQTGRLRLRPLPWRWGRTL